MIDPTKTAERSNVIDIEAGRAMLAERDRERALSVVRAFLDAPESDLTKRGRRVREDFEETISRYRALKDQQDATIPAKETDQ